MNTPPLFFGGTANIRTYGSYGLADFKNVSIVGHYVKDRTKDAQFIIIRLVNCSLWKIITGNHWNHVNN